MSIALTYDEYLQNMSMRIKNLTESLEDVKKAHKLFSEHPELYKEFERVMNMRGY